MTDKLKKPIEEVVKAIYGLDLDPIKFKLMQAEEGPGWSRDYAERMETEYKRFLVLSVKHPEQFIAPSKDVDKFWHAHILDTLKYADDCNRVFGYFLHHFPYVGLRGAEDAANRVIGAETMQRLYREEFGDARSSSAASDSASYCGIAAASYCGIANGEAHAAAGQQSYCGVAAASYCGIANGEAQAAAGQQSYCGVANDMLNVTNRPALPKTERD